MSLSAGDSDGGAGAVNFCGRLRAVKRPELVLGGRGAHEIS